MVGPQVPQSLKGCGVLVQLLVQAVVSWNSSRCRLWCAGADLGTGCGEQELVHNEVSWCSSGAGSSVLVHLWCRLW